MVRFDHVVVLGAGMAGLAAAAALADHADRVTVVERDRPPDTPATRPGTPQARHAHALLTSGVRALDALCPGLRAELVEAGAVEVAVPADVVWSIPAGRVPRSGRAHVLLTCTRDLLEHHLRRRVLAAANVRLLAGTRAVGLLGGPGAITGVSVRTRGAKPFELTAELVVDATGRSSATPSWLAELGSPVPEESVVDPAVRETSAIFQPRDDEPDWRALLLMGHQPGSAVLLSIEEGRWLLTLILPEHTAPPTTITGLREFAAALPDPALREALEHARAAGRVHGYGHTANRFRHYERLTPAPRGLLVVGDAACALNPQHGQGMSVALAQAVVLRRNLASALGRGADTAELQGMVSLLARRAWLVATDADLRAPNVRAEPAPGPPSPADRLFAAYRSRLAAAATRDPVVAGALLDVIHLLRPRRRLLRPDIVARVLRTRP